jgi:16S rRNA (adenine1518-N6/adenine1519-N6)-dimethyltransferase
MIALATTFHPARTPGTPRCLGQFVTIQREVAERLRAAPGSRDYGEMGVLVQAMAQVRRLAVLPPGCFWPPPKVDSEMVSITPRAEPLTDDPASLAALCRILFTHRRKQLGGVLAKHAPALLDALPPGVTATVRAEHLTVPQLVEMAHAWKNGQRNDRREHQERR